MNGVDILSSADVNSGNTAADAADEFIVEAVCRCSNLIKLSRSSFFQSFFFGKFFKDILGLNAHKVQNLESDLCKEHAECEEYANDCSAKGCGGCVYRHITYDHEKEIKKNYVKHAFIKVGLPDVIINDVHSTNKTREYRNKAQYPVVDGKIGFYAGSFDPLNLITKDVFSFL